MEQKLYEVSLDRPGQAKNGYFRAASPTKAVRAAENKWRTRGAECGGELVANVEDVDRQTGEIESWMSTTIIAIRDEAERKIEAVREEYRKKLAAVSAKYVRDGDAGNHGDLKRSAGIISSDKQKFPSCRK